MDACSPFARPSHPIQRKGEILQEQVTTNAKGMCFLPDGAELTSCPGACEKTFGLYCTCSPPSLGDESNIIILLKRISRDP